MSQINPSKVNPVAFAAAATTEVYNIYEVGAILKVSPGKVRQTVRDGTLPQALHAPRSARQWTKAMLTAAGVTTVTA